MKIPDSTYIQSIGLKVKSLENSLSFYEGSLGFRLIKKEGNVALLSASGKEPYTIKLIEAKDAKFAHRSSTGLYHTAFLLPDRKSLALVFRRLFETKAKFHGFSDHLVSEAIYLADPDDNGIELYIDKPKEQWDWKLGEVLMDSLPLDLATITSALTKDDKWDGIDPQTKIGHIHLKVSDLDKAEKFYNRFLGFHVSNSVYPGALFLAAGKYHHHVGTNVWHSQNGSPPPENSLGLAGYTINFGDKEYLAEIEKNAKESNIAVTRDSDGVLSINDFDNIKVRLVG